MLYYHGVGGVKVHTPKEVPHLSAVHETVPAVPEVEQVEHLSHVCNETPPSGLDRN